MSSNRFKVKYSVKSDSELQEIAASKDGYVLEARFAAIQLLNERGKKSEFEESVKSELQQTNQKSDKLKANKDQILKRLNSIPVGSRKVFLLQNGNELQIKRLNKQRFKVRIEDHYRSVFVPVLICEIKDDSHYRTYPFFFHIPIVIGAVIAALLVTVHSLKIFTIDHLLVAIFVSTVFPIFIQIITAPILYFVIKNNLESRLGK